MKSIAIPFRFENGEVASTTDNNQIAKQRIVDVLATRSYERVMRPEYGAGISDLLFEPLDPLIFSDYKVDALKTINDNVSNAIIKDLRIRESNNSPTSYGSDSDSTLSIGVVYSVANSGTATFTFVLDSTKILTEESRI